MNIGFNNLAARNAGGIESSLTGAFFAPFRSARQYLISARMNLADDVAVQFKEMFIALMQTLQCCAPPIAMSLAGCAIPKARQYDLMNCNADGLGR